VEHISVLFAPRTHEEIPRWLGAPDAPTPVPYRRVLAGALLMLGRGLAGVGRVSARPARRHRDAAGWLGRLSSGVRRRAAPQHRLDQPVPGGNTWYRRLSETSEAKRIVVHVDRLHAPLVEQLVGGVE
jgi:hypothetical protein